MPPDPTPTATGAASTEVKANEFQTMRSLLLRIHSARVAMNETALRNALDDVDALFREPNTN